MRTVNGNKTFIAEIKTQSPFGYKSTHNFNQLMDVALECGDWISVHTCAMWGGDYQTLSYVRKYTDKPIVAKGIHGTDDDIARAFDHGANYVLVVNRYSYKYLSNFDVSDKILNELTTFESLQNFNISGSFFDYRNNNYVWNSRDLRTGNVQECRIKELKDLQLKTVVQASNIKSIDDVHANADAFIVGTHLVDFCETLK